MTSDPSPVEFTPADSGQVVFVAFGDDDVEEALSLTDYHEPAIKSPYGNCTTCWVAGPRMQLCFQCGSDSSQFIPVMVGDPFG